MCLNTLRGASRRCFAVPQPDQRLGRETSSITSPCTSTTSTRLAACHLRGCFPDVTRNDGAKPSTSKRMTASTMERTASVGPLVGRDFGPQRPDPTRTLIGRASDGGGTTGGMSHPHANILSTTGTWFTTVRCSTRGRFGATAFAHPTNRLSARSDDFRSNIGSALCPGRLVHGPKTGALLRHDGHADGDAVRSRPRRRSSARARR